jgi:sugar/nucleoside kinase (ribokinase family)
VEIVREAMRCAAECALRVVFDPGGAVGDVDCGLLLRSRCFLIKPNEYEARMLTGVEVQDMRSATRAAAVLREHGADYALITHGRAGGYLFGDGIATHIPIPRVPPAAQPDSTGCGDQVMAVLCSQLSLNVDVLSAARAAIAAGTLQFGRVGIEPVTPAELATYL